MLLGCSFPLAGVLSESLFPKTSAVLVKHCASENIFLNWLSSHLHTVSNLRTYELSCSGAQFSPVIPLERPLKDMLEKICPAILPPTCISKFSVQPEYSRPCSPPHQVCPVAPCNARETPRFPLPQKSGENRSARHQHASCLMPRT